MLRIFLPLIALAITSTASSAPLNLSWSDKRDSANACYDQVDRDNEFVGLRTRLVFDSPTLQQISDESFPGGNDTDIIARLWQKYATCRAMMIDAMREYHPYLLPAYEIRNFQWDVVVTELVKRRITFGNANRLIHEAELIYRQRKAAYDQARSDRQRQAIADSLRADAARPGASGFPSGSGRLKCRWVGSTLVCDPY
jgi:hypothetical protein